MNTAVHDPVPACDGVHCYSHLVDEPDGEVNCGECFHAFPTKADLLADHNRLMREMDLAEETDPDRIWTCPHCAHDF